jgi:excisionase family DNA binding protein
VSERLLTARELAEQLGLSAGTVVDWAEAGRLPGFRLGGTKGGRLRFRESEVVAVLESWRFGPAPSQNAAGGRRVVSVGLGPTSIQRCTVRRPA